MPVVPPVSGAPAANTQSATSNPNGALTKDGFLKLFVAQLQHQDPMSPMDTSDSVAQMASFSMVEQITNMAGSNTKIEQSVSTGNAVALIGKTVSYLDINKTMQTGVVRGVATATDGTTSLTVGDKTGVNPSSITQVAASGDLSS
jgi:flagellar basal-body rod modification protein FlgD